MVLPLDVIISKSPKNNEIGRQGGRGGVPLISDAHLPAGTHFALNGISVTEDVYKQRETVDGFILIFGKGMSGLGETAFTTAPSTGPTTKRTQRE